MPDFDVIIIGAGASGLYCAWQAAQKGCRVALLDQQKKLGRKVALAGGGKGNYTNLNLDSRFYVGEDPQFCAGILRKFGPQQMIGLLEELGLPWEERDFGQIFGLRPAGDFVHSLRQRCQANGVAILPEHPVLDLLAQEDSFSISTHAQQLTAPKLVLATGSPACPQSGASGQGLIWAARFGHSIQNFRPALVPLLMPDNWLLRGLEGLSLNAKVCVHKQDGRVYGDPLPWRPLLFTHQGLSGPAGLIASCWWNPGDTLQINFLPETVLGQLVHNPQHGKLLLKNLLTRHLPQKLVNALLPEALGLRKCAEIGKKERLLLSDIFSNFSVQPIADAGFAKAEAARGGVLTAQIKPSLESKIQPGLYFCGELLDITGLLGGYNLHWAIASARRVAQAL